MIHSSFKSDKKEGKQNLLKKLWENANVVRKN